MSVSAILVITFVLHNCPKHLLCFICVFGTTSLLCLIVHCERIQVLNINTGFQMIDLSKLDKSLMYFQNAVSQY
jgi:hypothetical protein